MNALEVGGASPRLKVCFELLLFVEDLKEEKWTPPIEAASSPTARNDRDTS